MSTTANVKNWDPLFWPVVVAAALTPLAGRLLEQWLEPSIAWGLGIFAAWTLVGIAVSFKPPVPNWSLPKWIVCAAVGSTLGGGVAFLLDK